MLSRIGATNMHSFFLVFIEYLEVIPLSINLFNIPKNKAIVLPNFPFSFQNVYALSFSTGEWTQSCRALNE